MKAKCALLSGVFIGLVAILSGCMLDPAASRYESDGKPGYARFSFMFLRNDETLMKRQSADTAFSLDSVVLILSAPGAPTQEYRVPFTGRADLSDLVGSTGALALAPLRPWKIKIISIDTSITPLRRDTVHMDSMTFVVPLGDTVNVSFNIRPVYSVLRVRLMSTLPDSLLAGVRYVRVRVNGVTRDSIPVQGGVNRTVFFPTITTGWMADDSGRVLKSVDSGNTWSSQSTPTSRRKNGFWFNSTTEGWAVGNGGIILKSNGTTWTSQTSGLTANLNGVMFVSSSKGYAVGNGGRVLKTLDGGSHWDLMSGGWFFQNGGVSSTVNAVTFNSASLGWAVGDGGVIRTTANSGKDWSSQTSGVNTVLRGVHAISSSNVVAVGDGGVIRRTTNGGSTWSNVNSGTSADLRDVHFASASYGWAVGTGGAVRRSGNGGSSWSSQTSGITTRLNAVTSNSSNRVLAVGDNGAIRRSSSISSTSSFTNVSTTTIGSTQLNGVSMISGTNTAWVVGNQGFIAKSTNTNNNNWATQTSGTTEDLYEVYFANANTGWVTGAHGTILRTTDGGTNWTAQTSDTTENLYGVYAVNTDSVFAVGTSGIFLKTRSGGEVLTPAQNLNAVYFDADIGYVVGDAGTALRTTDGGFNWSALTGGTQNLRAVFISPSGNNAYVAGDNGEFMYTSNATRVSYWTVKNSGTSVNLYGIWVSADRIYAVGENGVMRTATTPGDLSGLTSGTTETLRSVQCEGTSNDCWAVGGNETVIRTTEGTTWNETTSGAKAFDQLLTYKYLKPGQTHTILIQAIDRTSPLRGFQATRTVTLGAGQDSTMSAPMTKCGYGGPTCTP